MKPRRIMRAQDGGEERRAVMAAVTHFLGNPVLGVVVRHRVADLIGEDSVSADELAQSVQLHPLSLVRALRFLAAFGIFRETENGRFANTPASKLLRNRPGGLRNYVFTKTSDAQMRAIAGLAFSLRTGESAFAHVNGEGRWHYLCARPEENKAMAASFAEVRGNEQIAIAEAYDWSGVRTVVDVGGGNGSLLAAILERQPQLRGVVFDRPEVLSPAESHLEMRGVRARCDVVGGDFFSPIRAGGDLWILSQVLHNWADEDCARILGNCRAGMRPGDRLLVIEMLTVACHPDPGIAMHDVLMMTNYGNARQRTEGEYRQLFARTSFRLSRVLPTEGVFSLVEAVATAM